MTFDPLKHLADYAFERGNRECRHVFRLDGAMVATNGHLFLRRSDVSTEEVAGLPGLPEWPFRATPSRVALPRDLGRMDVAVSRDGDQRRRPSALGGRSGMWDRPVP